MINLIKSHSSYETLTFDFSKDFKYKPLFFTSSHYAPSDLQPPLWQWGFRQCLPLALDNTKGQSIYDGLLMTSR